MRYSIEGQELTDIADVLRSKYGETKIVTMSVPVEIYDDTQNFSATLGHKCTTFTFPNAKTIYADVDYGTSENGPYFAIGAGEFTIDTVPEEAVKLFGGGNTPTTTRLVFENTDTITIYRHKTSVGFGYGCYATIYGCDENGNFVGDGTPKDIEVEVRRTYETNEFATAIDALGFLPEEALVVSGNCNYRFSNGGWDWFLEKYGNRITTEKLTNTSYMFYYSNVESIPFELNFDPSSSSHSAQRSFYMANKLIAAPKMNNCRPSETSDFFNGCYNLASVPEDFESWFDWSYIENQTSAYAGSMSNMFANCYSLRTIPTNLFNHANKVATYSYSYLSGGFNSCHALDELINLPLTYTSTWTSNVFTSTFSNCNRLKNITFAMSDGQPYAMKWKGQIIDLATNVGYMADTTTNKSKLLNYNSGITEDKEVKNDATYQALKDDPDWFATNIAYSRYNHDSAVATINSLPDTSAYLATAGGTNTIKFKRGSGSATDGGAVGNLTEAEIAVATAKGWTVTLVN